MALLQSRSVGSGRQRAAFSAGAKAPRVARLAARTEAAHDQQHEGTSRRDLLLSSMALLSSATLLPGGAAMPAAALADGEASFKELYDPILAYRFEYPVATSQGQRLSMVTSRAPEKYSSAAPLSADARQRIVSELVDLRKFVTVSVTVGPASGVLKGMPQEQWRPKDVAMTVLIDRSTARLSSGQRTALNDIEEVHREERDGQPYVVYEHISQGSPNMSNPNSKETYRHALAVTALRPGLDGKPYLYTLNLSCAEDMWAELQAPFQHAVDSFRLVETTNSYIPPDKDPWLFF